jgi:hypothetical protein
MNTLGRPMAAGQHTRPERRRLPIGVLAIPGFGIALVAFLAFALPIYSTTDRLLAWCVFVLATMPLIRYLRRPVGVPLFEFVALQYGLFFALPVFYEEKLQWYRFTGAPSSEAITITLTCCILALVALQVGYHVAAKRMHIKPRLLSFQSSTNRLFVFAVASVIGSLLVAVGTIDVGADARQAVTVIVSGDLGTALLGLLHYRTLLRRWQSCLAYALVAVSVLTGLVGGMTQAALQPALIWMMCQWIVQRRVPTKLAAVIVAMFFVLQPVKGAYRAATWIGSHAMSFGEKLAFYDRLIGDYWRGVATASDVAMDVQRSASTRLTLLMSTARFVELTPGQVDYKHGETISYAFYAFIPRLLWHDKPSAQVANKTLPVEYGMQFEGSTQTTMFGVGHVAEAYVNVGLVGILPLFLVLGMCYYVPVNLFKHQYDTPALAIVIALTVNIMWIGSTIGQSFGPIVQQIVVQGVLLRVLTGVPASRRPRSVPSDPLRVSSLPGSGS